LISQLVKKQIIKAKGASTINLSGGKMCQPEKAALIHLFPKVFISIGATPKFGGLWLLLRADYWWQ